MYEREVHYMIIGEESEVLNLFAINNKITKREMANRLNKSERTLQHIVSSLINNGLIERIGSNKAGYWNVADN